MAFVMNSDAISIDHHFCLDCFFSCHCSSRAVSGLSAGYHISKYRFGLRNKRSRPFARHRLEVDSHLAEGDLLQDRFSLPYQKHKLFKNLF